MEASAVQVGMEGVDREVERAINDLGIPPCPAVLTKLVREIRADDPDFRRVEVLVSADVGLAAAMLQTVNSPFYGLRSKVTSIQHALAVLGLRNVAQLVMGLLLRQAFPHSGSRAMERFWETSARVALIGAKIAGGAGVDRSEAHTFGLFRDCGMPVMLRKYPVYEDLLDGSALSVDVPITDIEAERYAFDHTMVGLHLAERWGLPESMQFAIRHHHDYAAWPALPRAAQGLAAVALVAEEVAARLSRRRSCADWALGGAAALACLDVDEDRVGEWAAATKAGLAGG